MVEEMVWALFLRKIATFSEALGVYRVLTSPTRPKSLFTQMLQVEKDGFHEDFQQNDGTKRLQGRGLSAKLIRSIPTVWPLWP